MLTRAIAAVLLVIAAPLAIASETVTIEASKDATLIEDPDGALANGAGAYFFAGRTNQDQGSVRRGLLAFDIASALPARALVESVTLELELSPSNPGAYEIRLHRVLADWCEGPTASAGGGGRPSQPGDVTWVHRCYDTAFWEIQGGQFIGRESARFTVDGAGTYVVAGDVHLLQDVRLWAAAPNTNFGWIIFGDETRRQTAQAFVSRENLDEALRPRLIVTYRVPGERP
jgi:hypothetical protein